MYDEYRFHPCPYWDNNPRHHPNHRGGYPIELKDYGPCPFVTNIEEAAKQNDFPYCAMDWETPTTYIDEY